MKIHIIFLVCLLGFIHAKERNPHKTKKHDVHIKEGDCYFKLAKVDACAEGNQTLVYVLKPRKDAAGSTCPQNKTISKVCDVSKKDMRKASRSERREKHNALGGKRDKTHLCNYSKGKWTECNKEGTRFMTLMLKPNSPSQCKPNRTISITCIDRKMNPRKKNGCRYLPGKFTECTDTTETQERVDTLHNSSSPNCPPVKKITKGCIIKNIFKCTYHYGEWSSECIAGKRIRIESLQHGYSTESCVKTKNITQNCTDSDGKEACFYGEWEEGQCSEDGKTRNDSRLVKFGGEDCQSGTIQTVKCRREQKLFAKKTEKRMAKFNKIAEPMPRPSVPGEIPNKRKMNKRKQDKSDSKSENEDKKNNNELRNKNKKQRKEQREIKKAERIAKKEEKVPKKLEKVSIGAAKTKEEGEIDQKKMNKKAKKEKKEEKKENRKMKRVDNRKMKKQNKVVEKASNDI